jgi:hypothetical protein
MNKIYQYLKKYAKEGSEQIGIEVCGLINGLYGIEVESLIAYILTNEDSIDIKLKIIEKYVSNEELLNFLGVAELQDGMSEKQWNEYCEKDFRDPIPYDFPEYSYKPDRSVKELFNGLYIGLKQIQENQTPTFDYIFFMIEYYALNMIPSGSLDYLIKLKMKYRLLNSYQKDQYKTCLQQINTLIQDLKESESYIPKDKTLKEISEDKNIIEFPEGSIKGLLLDWNENMTRLAEYLNTFRYDLGYTGHADYARFVNNFLVSPYKDQRQDTPKSKRQITKDTKDSKENSFIQKIKDCNNPDYTPKVDIYQDTKEILFNFFKSKKE